jgi:hypothetical protein
MAEGNVYDQYDEDIGVDSDEDKKYSSSNRTEWFKGDKGRCYRVALVYFHTVDVCAVSAAKTAAKKAGRVLSEDDIEKVAKEALTKRAASLSPPKKADELTAPEKLEVNQVKFKRLQAHYKDGVGFVLSRLGLDGPEADQAWKAMGDQKNYFTTVALFYPCDKDGNLPRKGDELDKSRIMNDWHVLPWRFGGKNYDGIWTVNKGLRSNDLTIADQDLILRCENAEFQNFKITGGGKSTWRKSPELMRRVLERAIPFYDKLIPFREMSTADLQIKLGLSTGNKGEEVSTEIDSLMDDTGSI